MQPVLMQTVSFCGALMVLVAYVGHQAQRMDARGVAYNLLNAAGSGILLFFAFRPFQLGFVVMEGAWVCVSVWGLLHARRVLSDGSAERRS